MVSPYGQQCGNPTPGCLSERTPQRERRAHPCSRPTRRDAAARASTDRGADNEKARTTCDAILRGLEQEGRQEGRPEDEPRGRFTQRNKPDTKGQTPRSSARVRHRVVKFTEKGGSVVCAGGRGGCGMGSCFSMGRVSVLQDEESWRRTAAMAAHRVSILHAAGLDS